MSLVLALRIKLFFTTPACNVAPIYVIAYSAPSQSILVSETIQYGKTHHHPRSIAHCL
jgi:hypothetical protein